MNDTPEAVEATIEDFLYANGAVIKKTEVKPTDKENRLEIVFYAENNVKTLKKLYKSLEAISDTHKRGIRKVPKIEEESLEPTAAKVIKFEVKV